MKKKKSYMMLKWLREKVCIDCVIKFLDYTPFLFLQVEGQQLKMGQLQKAFCFYLACIQLTPMFYVWSYRSYSH